MSEQDAGAAVTQQPGISLAEAAQRAADLRAPAAGKNTDVSDAARKLNAAKAEKARLMRTTSQAEQVQKPAQAAGGGNGLNDPADEEGTQTEIDTADDGSPSDVEAEDQDESQDSSGTIDLGDGVTVTLDEVRDNFMLKADHTRKTQALAAERQQLEAIRTQRLSQLENTLQQLQQNVGKPKSMSEWLEADPVNGLRRFAHQQDQLKQASMARAIAAREEKASLAEAHDRRDAALADSYNKEWADTAKRDAAYTALSKYATGLGATPEHLINMTEPWMIKVLDMAQKYEKLQADKGGITKQLAAKPKVVKVGAKVSAQSTVQNGLQVARANLEKSNSVQDAVAFYRASKKARGAAS